jgi:hypothetical protein
MSGGYHISELRNVTRAITQSRLKSLDTSAVARPLVARDGWQPTDRLLRVGLMQGLGGYAVINHIVTQKNTHVQSWNSMGCSEFRVNYRKEVVVLAARRLSATHVGRSARTTVVLMSAG